MNTKYFILALSIASLTACSTAYQAGQTPDDVYYSPAKDRGDAYVQMEKRGTYNNDRDAYNDERYGGSGTYSYYSPEDRFLRMRVQNRALWSGLDPYFFEDYNYYGMHSPYMGGMGHGYYGGFNHWNYGFNSFGLHSGFSPWGSSFMFGRPWGYSMWNSYYNPYMPPVFVVPGDKGNISNSNNRVPANRLQNVNPNSYRNSTINNRNNSQGTFRNGNTQRTTINNSNSNRNNRSSTRDTYTPPSTPNRTYNPVNSGSNSGSRSSGSSSSGSSNSGGGVSRPTRN